METMYKLLQKLWLKITQIEAGRTVMLTTNDMLFKLEMFLYEKDE